jgi:hypothetical protein
MDRVMNSIPAINQADMPTDNHVAIPRGGWGKAAHQFRGRWAAHSPHLRIEHVALTQPRLVLRRQSVAVPEPTLVSMLVVIILRDLTIMIIEPSIVLTTPIIPAIVARAVISLLSALLCHSGTARQGKGTRCASAKRACQTEQKN